MNEHRKVWFRLFACCIVVEGASSSLIYDIQRDAFYDLPNDFLSIINSSSLYDVDTIKNTFEYEDNVIDSFFNHFIEAEIGFYTHEPASFPAIDLTWDSPHNIVNSIIELVRESGFDWINVIEQLNSLGCKAIQLQLLSDFTVDELRTIIHVFKDSRFKHIELMLPFNNEMDRDVLCGFMKDEPRLNQIMIYACSEDKLVMNEYGKSIVQFKKDIRVDQNEILKVEKFSTNVELFSEAQNYNVGLNRKVCIDKMGEIRNYVSHRHSYGNVSSTSILDVLEKTEFKNKWSISNDMIETCKDCQYRYACVSNSDIRKEGDKFYKSNYCDYVPNINSPVREI